MHLQLCQSRKFRSKTIFHTDDHSTEFLGERKRVAQEKLSVSKDQSTAMYVVKRRTRSIRSFDRSQNGHLDFSLGSWDHNFLMSNLGVCEDGDWITNGRGRLSSLEDVGMIN